MDNELIIESELEEDTAVWETLLRRVIPAALAAEGVGVPCEVDVLLTNDEGIRRVTAASDVSIRDMVREKTVVYMHLMEEGAPYMVLMTAFMNQWWRIAQAEAALEAARNA